MYRTPHDPQSERPSTRILEAVGAVRGVVPTELDPLGRAVEPDAIDAMFQANGDMATARASLSFDYEGLLIVVRGDGEIELRERD